MFPGTMGLVELLEHPEGETLEFKRQLSSPDGRQGRTVLTAIGEAFAFVAEQALHGAEIGAVRRRESWNLPPWPCARR